MIWSGTVKDRTFCDLQQTKSDFIGQANAKLRD